MEKLFIKAAKNKFRFNSSKGMLTVEDLFDLPLTHFSKANLNDIAKNLNKQLKEAGEDDFVNTVNSGPSKELEEKMEIIKFVIEHKKQVLEVANKRATTMARNARIDELIAKKQDEELAGMSIEELEALKGQ